VLITELLVLVLTLANSSLVNFSWSSLGVTSLFVQWIVLASAALLCNLRSWLAKQQLIKSVLIAYTLVLATTLIMSVIGEWILLKSESWRMETYGRIARNLIIAAIMSGIAFRYLFLQYQLQRQEQAELNSRIQALQSRIRPHFLFNSMNIIASLISVDPDLAERVVEDLSELFRASLSDMTNEPVPLAQELALCQKYAHIESLRLDERLQLEWQIDVDVNEVHIPMLTLQPLLENAIYHGIQPLPEGGLVTVIIKELAGKLQIDITNPIAVDDYSRQTGNRMALENIRHRLQAVYGSEAEVITEQDHEYFHTLIRYPFALAISR